MQQIFKGSASNDKTGTPARQAADIINANFDYLEKKIENRNKVLVNAGFTQDGNEITFNAGWKWIIGELLYQNPVPVIIDVPVAAAALSRIDNIVVTTSNTFVRLAGAESETPVVPVFVEGTIVITFCIVGDGGIETVDPIDSLKSLHPYNLFKFVQKGFGNTDLQNDQIGDIFCGWSDDGTLRYLEAKWLGGPLNTSNSFKPLITIIIE